jgi:hypothetical protein
MVAARRAVLRGGAQGELTMRTWLIALALTVLPLVVYWPTVSHEYGFRDDYAHLREVRERPGWLMQLTTSNGRPVYGFALDTSLRSIYEVQQLKTLRVVGTVLMGIVGALLWWQLLRSGWREEEAAALGAAVTLLPGTQVVVGWAIAWPIALALVAGMAGFSLVDRGLDRRGPKRAALVAAGGALYFVTGLTYQTSALFAVVPFAAALLLRHGSSARSDLKWTLAHLGTLFMALFAGFLMMNVMFSEGVVPEAARMQLEPHPFVKLLWFFRNPVPNSLALFALRDSYATPFWFWLVVAAVVVIAVLGFVHGAKDVAQRRRWLFAALFLPFVAHSVSLAASSQAIGYRTLLPLSGLFLVLFAFGLRATFARFPMQRIAAVATFAAFTVAGAVLAHHNALTLIAEPQGREWQLIEEAVNGLTLTNDTRVYIVRPTPDYRSTERIYADGHGSLSADAQWAAVEMFRAAMRQRFPRGLPEGLHYTLVTSLNPPNMAFDFVLDLRRLRTLGDRRNPTASLR